MANNNEGKNLGSGTGIRIALIALFFIMAASVITNIYLLKRTAEDRKKVEQQLAAALELQAKISAASQAESAAVKPAGPAPNRVAEADTNEAFNNLVLACLKKGVVPLNTGQYTVEEIKVYTVMANHNVFLEGFTVIAGDKEEFDEQMKNDVKAKEFYDRWAEYEQAVKDKTAAAKKYISRFDAKKNIFLKVLEKELTEEEKALFKSKKGNK